MAFISGNNLGGKDVDYYDNPNYDPKNDGKSKGDKKKSEALEAQGHSDYLNERKYTFGEPIEYEFLQEADSEAAYAKLQADKQVEQTVSYFRAKERERLNPGGAGKKIINEKFSKPSGSIEDKLGKFGFSYDPADPDTFFDMENRFPSNAVSENSRTYDTGSVRTGGNWNEETIEFAKGEPMPKTVAGVNQELQAIKARTRDAAMEFRGRVYDFIEELGDDFQKDITFDMVESDNLYSRGYRPPQPMGYDYIENKYFPNSADKTKARNTILKMIDSTDNEAPVNTLRGVAEEMAAVKDPGLRDFGIGAASLNEYGASNENTLKNLESGIKEFQAWKAKKGVPRIIRLIKNLP